MRNNVDVTVRQGKLRGTIERRPCGLTYNAFRGIPYAKPPIGELRFKDPEPAEPWNDVRDATKLCNTSLHFDFFHKRAVGDEDCLYLNVFTKDIHLQTKRAVMVWIHGHNFHFASKYNDFYGPDYFITRDVVLVTINYRLGVFGFFNVRNEMAWGNQGLKDALMALQWVHDNISNFGGDSGNVTIFGQGFGGCMVHYLAMCPQADGLCHKAISQSGTAANTWAFSDTYLNMSFRLVKTIGGSTEDMKEAVKCLKSLDAYSIVKASEIIVMSKERRQFISAFVPSYDFGSPNPFFVENQALMLLRGVKVPFIIGFTTAEGSVFVHDIKDYVLNDVNSDFASIIHPTVLQTLREKSVTAEDLRQRYFGNEPVSRTTIQNYMKLIGDMHFYSGIFNTATIQTRMGHRSTYLYHFSHDSECSFLKTMLKVNFAGTTCGEELFYLFYPRIQSNSKRNMGLDKLKRTPVQKRITDQVTQMWTDFAKTGNPTPAVTPIIPIKWMPLEKEDELQFLTIDKRFRMETMQNRIIDFLF